MTELYTPDFNEPDLTASEQLEALEKRRWDIYDDLRVVNMLIANLKNRMKGGDRE